MTNFRNEFHIHNTGTPQRTKFLFLSFYSTPYYTYFREILQSPMSLHVLFIKLLKIFYIFWNAFALNRWIKMGMILCSFFWFMKKSNSSWEKITLDLFLNEFLLSLTNRFLELYNLLCQGICFLIFEKWFGVFCHLQLVCHCNQNY